jgi:hypothetical protein
MAKGKQKSKSSPVWVKGGNGHMLGQQHAGPQTPGQTASNASASGGEWAKGGNGHMVGKQTAKPATAA